MKCDTCKFKKIHIGVGPPDDYSVEYCSKGHWEGGPIDEEITHDAWTDCIDYRCQDCGGSGCVQISEEEFSDCPCSA